MYRLVRETAQIRVAAGVSTHVVAALVVGAFALGAVLSYVALRHTDAGHTVRVKAAVADVRRSLAQLSPGSAKVTMFVDQVEVLADRACACADAACTTAVGQDFMNLISGEPPGRGTLHDKYRVEAAAERMTKCVMDRGGALPF